MYVFVQILTANIAFYDIWDMEIDRVLRSYLRSKIPINVLFHLYFGKGFLVTPFIVWINYPKYTHNPYIL